MLCLGPKKSLMSPRLKITSQGLAYRCSKVECEDHSAIQAPPMLKVINCQFYISLLGKPLSTVRWPNHANRYIPAQCSRLIYLITSGSRLGDFSSSWRKISGKCSPNICRLLELFIKYISNAILHASYQ